MWCSFCEQDVPGVASINEDQEVVCCARCGEPLGGQVAPSDSPNDELLAVDMHSAGMPSWDDWELDEKLHDVDRLLREVGGTTTHAARNWPPQQERGEGGYRPDASGKQSRPVAGTTRRKRSSWLAWLVLSLGLMTFVCGAVLLGWSFFVDKSLLWRIGLPLSLVGQAGLLIGLILQLEGLWQNDHEATETLDQLDQQIRELRHAAVMLNATHSRPGQSFYLHMAEGASPHLMLADLKSQLDLLAIQLDSSGRSSR